MSEHSFDAYGTWLHLAARPANYYELLGLPIGEPDLERIRLVHQRTVSAIRQIRPGRYASDWTALLDELEAAGICLLDRDAKQAYDDRLRGPLEPDRLTESRQTNSDHGEPSVRALIDPMAPVDFDESVEDLAIIPPVSRSDDRPAAAQPASVQPLVIRQGAGRRRSKRAQRRRAFGWRIWSVVVLSLIVVGAGIAWVVFQRETLELASMSASSRMSLDRNATADDAPSVPDVPEHLDPAFPVPTDRPETTELSEPRSINEPGTMQSFEDAGPSVVESDPDDHRAAMPASSALVDSEPSPVEPMPLTEMEWQQLRQLLGDAFAKLCVGDHASATACIEAARVLTDGTTAADRVERIATLANYDRQFQAALDAGLTRVENAELEVGNTRVFVVDVDSNQVVVRVSGENRRYPRSSLPRGLALAVADLDAQAPSTPVFQGVFVLLSPPHDHAEVRQLWSAAASRGVDVEELEQLLAELADYQ